VPVRRGQGLGLAGQVAFQAVHCRGQGGDPLADLTGVTRFAVVQAGQLLGQPGELEQGRGQPFWFGHRDQLHG